MALLSLGAVSTAITYLEFSDFFALGGDGES